MAAIEKTSLKLRLENGVDKNNKKKYATVVVNRINPQVGVEDLQAIGKAVAGLQTLNFVDMSRVETKAI